MYSQNLHRRQNQVVAGIITYAPESTQLSESQLVVVAVNTENCPESLQITKSQFLDQARITIIHRYRRQIHRSSVNG